MLTARPFTRNVKTDDDRLSGWMHRHLLGWRFILHNDWNAHRFVALCVACFLLMCNANERVHGAYGRASEGELLLVDHDQCLTLPHNGVTLAWTYRLRPCSSHKQLLCPMHAGDPDIAKPHTYMYGGFWKR